MHQKLKTYNLASKFYFIIKKLLNFITLQKSHEWGKMIKLNFLSDVLSLNVLILVCNED